MKDFPFLSFMIVTYIFYIHEYQLDIQALHRHKYNVHDTDYGFSG